MEKEKNEEVEKKKKKIKKQKVNSMIFLNWLHVILLFCTKYSNMKRELILLITSKSCNIITIPHILHT